MDLCETRISIQLICTIPVRNKLTTIIKCSAWSQIDSRWSPSELNINVLVSAVYIIWLSYACCISLLGETYVSCKTSLTCLECSISLLIINSPLKNLCFSTIHVLSCMLYNTNLVDRKQCCCVQFSLIKLIKIQCSAFIVVSCLKLSLRQRQLSDDLLLDIEPLQILLHNVLITTIDGIRSSYSCHREYLLLILSILISNLELQVTYASNLIVNSIGQDNTYQWLTVHSSRILQVVCLFCRIAIRLLLTTFRHLGTHCVTIGSNSCMSTLRSFIYTLMITNQFE